VPRPSLTPSERSAKVLGAIRALETTHREAEAVAAALGWNHPDTLEAFGHVEMLGATVHRQSRLLAGKSKGG
jgi:hypothetical protein